MKTFVTKLQNGDNKAQMTLFIVSITVAAICFLLFETPEKKPKSRQLIVRMA